MNRFAIVLAATLLAVAAPAPSLASAPVAGVTEADQAGWAALDKELAAMPEDAYDAKARRILDHNAFYAEDRFQRLIHLPCDTTREFYVAVLTDPENSYHWNAHFRKLAAWGLGVTGEPKHAAILKKVAATDPLTNDRAGTAPMMKGSAREAAQQGLEELARRYPDQGAGWLR